MIFDMAILSLSIHKLNNLELTSSARQPNTQFSNLMDWKSGHNFHRSYSVIFCLYHRSKNTVLSDDIKLRLIQHTQQKKGREQAEASGKSLTSFAFSSFRTLCL